MYISEPRNSTNAFTHAEQAIRTEILDKTVSIGYKNSRVNSAAHSCLQCYGWMLRWMGGCATRAQISIEDITHIIPPKRKFRWAKPVIKSHKQKEHAQWIKRGPVWARNLSNFSCHTMENKLSLQRNFVNISTWTTWSVYHSFYPLQMILEVICRTLWERWIDFFSGHLSK